MAAPVAQRYHVTSDTLGREFDHGKRDFLTEKLKNENKRGRTRTTQRSFWARSSAELNQGDPDVSVRILRSSRGSTNSPTFYLPSNIGLLKLNFRNAITLRLHERASCWSDFTWTTDEHIWCSCTCETCFFCVCVFFHFFIFFCRLSVQNITHHMTKLYSSKDPKLKQHLTASFFSPFIFTVYLKIVSLLSHPFSTIHRQTK